MNTKITEMLGIKYPVIQGGMANIATGKFAAAVSNAGGLGLIGSGGWDALCCAPAHERLYCNTPGLRRTAPEGAAPLHP